eukprot:m.62638 g.62638  ORF g.62638 m.62638 type:complete len:373 (-) comp19385_c1_seq1:170-1288(-)
MQNTPPNSHLPNMLPLPLLAIILCSALLAVGELTNWEYSTKRGYGPANWHNEFPACGTRTDTEKQSPVAIVRRSAVVNHDLSSLQLGKGYYEPKDGEVFTNGHTLEVGLPSGSSAQLTLNAKNPLGEEFELEQLHFHWGPDNDKGSEHTLNGYRYPLEMHLVNYRKSETFAEAVSDTDETLGLAVVSQMFRIGKHNSEIEKILKPVRQGKVLRATDDPVGISLVVANLVRLGSGYYHYRGSLTTPPCFQSVLWLVNRVPLQVSEDQMKVFRSIFVVDRSGNHNAHLLFNYRPVQPLNGRIVQVSGKPPKTTPTTAATRTTKRANNTPASSTPSTSSNKCANLRTRCRCKANARVVTRFSRECGVTTCSCRRI